jgi:hypothetical protein
VKVSDAAEERPTSVAQHEGTTSAGADSSDVSLAVSDLAGNLQTFKNGIAELSLLPKEVRRKYELLRTQIITP